MKLLVIDSSTDPSSPANECIREAADEWMALGSEPFGHGQTRNRAVDVCSSKVIVFLSQDAHPADDAWLACLVRPLACGQAEASYGRQRPRAPNREREATFGYLYPDTAEIKTKQDVPRLGLRAFHFSNVSSAFLTDTVRELRFPENIPTFEDIGVAKRLLDDGRRIAYVPEAVVLHSHDLGAGALFRRYRQIGSVYETLGLFKEVKQNVGPPLAEGLRVLREIRPSGGSLSRKAHAAAVAGLKAAAVGLGRLEARRGRGGMFI